MEAPSFVASTRTASAAFIDRNHPGDAQRGRTLIDAALLATKCGYGYVERDARDLIQRIGTNRPV